MGSIDDFEQLLEAGGVGWSTCGQYTKMVSQPAENSITYLHHLQDTTEAAIVDGWEDLLKRVL